MIVLLTVSILTLLLAQTVPVLAQGELASLTGTFTDEGVDTDGDGAYNYLKLGVEVNVTAPGTYKVDAGGLYDQIPNWVSLLTVNTSYLDAGIHTVNIWLNGTGIYVAGVNPYYIAGIKLYAENGTELDALTDVTLSKQYTFDEFQRPEFEMEINKVERQIFLDEIGSIYVANSYRITINGFKTDTVELGYPDGAYDFAVRDEMGTLEFTAENGTIKITLRQAVEAGETETLYTFYRIPWEKCLTHQDGINYSLDFTFYEEFNSTIGELTVSVALPKGAQFQSSTPIAPDSIEKNNNQETLKYSFSNVNPSDNLNFSISYKYLIIWTSFYPTVWMGILAVAAAAALILWKAPKPPAAAVIQVPTTEIKSFVESYEEKLRIREDLAALEERVRKGKIPRRRYKVRRKMLEARLSTLSRMLSSLGDKIRSAGPTYANLLRQIEVAETSLEGAERELQRVEARYRRGEISKGAYGKLVEEYRNRIEEAEATIDGVLLRLRE